MAGKIIIDTERCKGCGLCVVVCPKDYIVMSEHSNKNGYFPAQPVPSIVEGATNDGWPRHRCSGCANCALICSEAIIKVYRDDNIKSVETGKKDRRKLSKEKV